MKCARCTTRCAQCVRFSLGVAGQFPGPIGLVLGGWGILGAGA